MAERSQLAAQMLCYEPAILGNGDPQWYHRVRREDEGS
jgi:hypothetical protein